MHVTTDLSTLVAVRMKLWVKLAEKASTNEVIVGLSNALRDENVNVRKSACHTLAEILEKAATTETITALFNALADKDEDVRSTACIALRKFGEKSRDE